MNDYKSVNEYVKNMSADIFLAPGIVLWVWEMFINFF